MKATETNFLKFLQGTKQFIIPIFQRNYSWTLKQCQQLWNDILRTAKDDNIPGHFIGSIVYIEKGIYQVASVPQLLLIDGQQRLTTISLLLHALGKAIEESGNQTDITEKKINNYYLFNSEETDEKRFKVLLTKADKETLMRLIEDKELPTPSSSRIIENYNFFEEQIRKTKPYFNMIYQGIGKLIIVDISLDRDHDNPQLIFESLNSTGLDLSQADLIRNYVLMGLEPRHQEALYNDYWLPMEQGFGQADYVAKFDRFMRDYLTVRTGRIPNIREVYEAFKIHAQGNKGGAINDIVTELYQYSKLFIKMALGREEYKELKEIFNDINTLKVDVAYPFLLELYHDYVQNLVNKDEFVEILRLIESYVFRRAICGIPTNSLNKTFATLSRELDKENYLESFKAVLQLKDSYRRFPDDDEFVRELVVKDIYSFRNRNYCLRNLENHERKEKVNVEEYTIEHIMPQNENLSSEWKKELGEDWRKIHTHYLHTIGNLTLTGYNPELSDRPFLEKRNMKGGFADSPLRLNRSLATLEHWNEEEIKRRANSLAEQSIKVWQAPSLPEKVLEKYKAEFKTQAEEIYTIKTMEGHEHLQGSMLELYEQLSKRILNIDASVKEEVKKLYIAYKTTTNFVDIVPQKSRLRLSLNLRFDEIDDPNGICRDVTNLGRWGNGDVEVGISSPDEIEYVMFLIGQAFQKHAEDSGE